jgi:hypothetical protein
MSAAVLTRLEIMRRFENKRLTQKEASEILGLSIRQIKRIWRSYRRYGAAGIKNKGSLSDYSSLQTISVLHLLLLKNNICHD